MSNMSVKQFKEECKASTRRKHPESLLQQSCVKIFRASHPKESMLLFAIPNGGARSKIEAGIMRGEGILPGVADLFLMKAKGNFHGLWMELKVGKNILSVYQEAFRDNAIKQGYAHVVIYSIDDFIETISNYYSLV